MDFNPQQYPWEQSGTWEEGLAPWADENDEDYRFLNEFWWPRGSLSTLEMEPRDVEYYYNLRRLGNPDVARVYIQSTPFRETRWYTQSAVTICRMTGIRSAP